MEQGGGARGGASGWSKRVEQGRVGSKGWSKGVEQGGGASGWSK